MSRIDLTYVPNTAKPFAESDIPFHVISSDTLSEPELAMRFIDTLRLLEASEDDIQLMLDMEPEEACDYFWNIVLSCLPEGYECSASEGDGACFGIWPTEDHVNTCRIAYVEACGLPVAGDVFWSDKGIHAFAFGAYGWTRVAAFGRLEDALEEAAEWLAKHAPGIFCTEAVNEAYNEAYAVACLIALISGCDVDDLAWQCTEHAESDTTRTESGYIASHEWTLIECDDLAALCAFAFEHRDYSHDKGKVA